MNILPKKRWHVRTKDNIARVRRDEAQAAEEEKQIIQRAKLAEQEARTAYLRAKARTNYDGGYNGTESSSVATKSGKESSAAATKSQAPVDIYTTSGNINFFKDVEEGKNTQGTNKEYEEEKKAEQEKYEKAIGYLTYLGQDSIEAKGGKAWYADEVGRVTRKEEDDEMKEEVGLKSKNKLDPMCEIMKYLGPKPKKRTVVTPKPVTTCEIPTIPGKKIDSKIKYETNNSKRQSKKESSRRKKHKKDRHKRKRNKHYSDDSDREMSSKKHSSKKTSVERKRKRSSSSDDSEEETISRKRRKGRHMSRDRNKRSKRSKHKEDRRSHRRASTSGSDSGRSSRSSMESFTEESSDDEQAQREKQKKLEILRAERLKREAEERKRAERLLAGLNPNKEAPKDDKPAFQQKYNTQFNPHLARQNQDSKPLEAGVKYWLQ